MKEYIVKDENDKFHVIQKTYVPPNSVGLMIPGEDPRWIKIGDITDPETGDIRQGPMVDETVKAAVQAADAIEATAKGKVASVTDKYNEMSTAVYDEMKNIFYTTKSDSASANYEMWKHMLANAALYSGKGLKAEYLLKNLDDTELYSAGSALDTDPKIVAYATRKLEQADEYIVWRSDRIQQFRNERDVINA